MCASVANVGPAGTRVVGKDPMRATQEAHSVALREARGCWCKRAVLGLVWKEKG
jgi:hypothetical protein